MPNSAHPVLAFDQQVSAVKCDGHILGPEYSSSRAQGCLPPPVEKALAPLIPKKQGGYRDLLFCSAFYRCGMRARRPYAQEWENCNDRPYFASGAAKSCVDPVWRASIMAEPSVASKEAAAVVTQDMVSFFLLR